MFFVYLWCTKTNETRYVIRGQSGGDLLHGRRFLQVFNEWEGTAA